MTKNDLLYLIGFIENRIIEVYVRRKLDTETLELDQSGIPDERHYFEPGDSHCIVEGHFEVDCIVLKIDVRCFGTGWIENRQISPFTNFIASSTVSRLLHVSATSSPGVYFFSSARSASSSSLQKISSISLDMS